MRKLYEKKTEYIWLAVTPDEYEFPIGVFESISDLLKYSGRNIKCLYSAICRHSIDRKRNCKYYKVDLKKDYNDCFSDEISK